MEEVTLTLEEFQKLMVYFQDCMTVMGDDEQVELALREGPLLDMLFAIADRHSLPSEKA